LGICATVVVPFILPAFRPSLLPFFILLPGVVLATVFKVLSSDFNGRGQPLKTFGPTCAALAIELVAGTIFIPRFGLSAAALVTTASYALNSFLYGRTYRNLTGVSFSELTLLQYQDLHRLRSAVQGLLLSLKSDKIQPLLDPQRAVGE
jgi:O-antigen/teichoic acid export membrane protein